MRPPAPSSASPPRSRSAPWGSSASSPTTRARRSARCSRSASCSPPRSSGCWSLATGAGRKLRTPAAARRRLSPSALGAVGYSAQAGCLLRRAAASRRVAALAAALHVPGDGHGRRDRARARAGEPADGRRARARLGRPRARAGRRGRRCARSGRDAAGRSRPRSSTRRTSSPRPASPIASARSLLSALVCTGAAATLTLGHGAVGRPAPRRVSAAGFGWLAAIAVVSTVGAVSLFFAGLKRVGADDRLDPLDGRAGDHGRPGLPGLRRVARRRCSSPAGRW